MIALQVFKKPSLAKAKDGAENRFAMKKS